MKMDKKEMAVIVAIFLTLLLVSGQAGCPQQTAKRTGVDYNLISGVDYLSAGKMLQQGESFYVGVRIENYDDKARTGQLCIRDNIADTFGGLPSEGFGECKFFSVRAAEIVRKEVSGLGGKQIKEEVHPGIAEVYFPEDAEYSYYGLPSLMKPYLGILFISLQYRETTRATGTITVPDPGQPVITQEPSPIKVSVIKSIHKRQEAYKVDLDINLVKQQQARIFSQDFSRENVTYFMAEMVPQTMQCKTTTGEPVSGIIEFENERLIKCSSLVYSRGSQASYPLVVTLDYGVAIEKSYPFSIDTSKG
ncbi:MAG: hypothetical protein K6T16_00180 [Candidatus Pacearchaeota archaeon]|nr:hypothetical protein [Candidatus Pacearchaeota archaeon]